MHRLKEQVQVAIPFSMLYDTYLDRFLQERLNPEIAVGAEELDRFELEDFARVAELLQQRSLKTTLHAPFMDLSAGSADSAVRAVTRQRLKQLLDLVPVFQPLTVVCHAGYDWRRYGYDPAGWYERSLDVWTWFARAIGATGSKLVLENVYETDPEEMLAILKPLGGHGVGFCLDAGHQVAFGGASLDRWCGVLADYLAQLHLHDNLGCRDDHLGLGEGCINFDELLKLVKSLHDRQPVVTLEVHREEQLLPSLSYLEEIWPW